MTGESLQQDHIRRDIERQTARLSHLTTADIGGSYVPQILATARPTRPNHSPD